MHRAQSWFWAPLLAMQFLTRIPVRGIPQATFDDPGAGRRALVFFPLVGALVGTIGAGVWAAARLLGLPPLASAVLAVSATALTTGALHEDGLADVFDALGTHTRERALEVMRDSRIGAFGSVALWSVLTLKACALSALPDSAVWRVLACAHMAARWSSLPLALLLPDARKGSGLGAGFAALVTWREVAAATAVTALAIAFLADGAEGILFGAAALGAIFASGLFYRRRFGGVTGDCLGATNQGVEVLVLLIGAAHDPLFHSHLFFHPSLFHSYLRR